jgi:hypothetical protein
VECGHGQEWEPHNIVYVTGHADGSIEVRSLFFVACAATVWNSFLFFLFPFLVFLLQFWGVVEDQLCRLQRFGAPTAQSPVTALYMRPYAVLPSKPTALAHTTRHETRHNQLHAAISLPLLLLLRTQRRQGAVQR